MQFLKHGIGSCYVSGPVLTICYGNYVFWDGFVVVGFFDYALTDDYMENS
jgi:hypothetical protein